MGLALWLAAGVAAVIIARIVPLALPRSPLAEVIAAPLASLAAGLAATALDFGGWQEADWRAGVFALLVALAAIGVVRLRPA